MATSYVSAVTAVTTVWHSPKPPQHRLSPQSRNNFEFRSQTYLLTGETLSCFAVKTICSYFVTVHSYHRQIKTTFYNQSRTLLYNCNIQLKAICFVIKETCFFLKKIKTFVLKQADISSDVMCCYRYGWIPDDGDVSYELRSKYDWVSGLSVTHMEILHGAYRQVYK